MFVSIITEILALRGFRLTFCQPWCERPLAWEASH